MQDLGIIKRLLHSFDRSVEEPKATETNAELLERLEKEYGTKKEDPFDRR